MKLFGEFMVESKAISEEQLLEALLAQLKLTPSVGVILFENKLMSNTKILQILSHQARHKLGFIESAKALGFWSKEISAGVETIISQARPPLGQILAKNCVLAVEDLSRLLDDFLDTLKADEVLRPERELNTQGVEQEIQEPSPFLEVYSEGLQEGFVNNVQLFTLWLDMSDADRTVVTDFFGNQFHLFQGVLRLLGLTVEEKLFNDLEAAVRDMFKQMIHYDGAKILKVQMSMANIMSNSWSLRECLSEGSDKLALIDILRLSVEDLQKTIAETSTL